jgi:hypothetical protein
MEDVMYYFCHAAGISDPNIVEIATGVVCAGVALAIMAAIFIRIMDLAEGVLNRILPE